MRNFERKRPPRWTAPVPETVWRVQTWGCVSGGICEEGEGRMYAAFLDSRRFGTKDELLSTGSELSETGDGEIFVVDFAALEFGGVDLVSLCRL